MNNLILIILTSHRKDGFTLCLHNLERFTLLDRFKFIYILANAVDEEHADIISDFKTRHRNVIDIHFDPRGIYTTVAIEGFVLDKHRDDIIVKLDEDVFVTAGWLEPMLETYRATRNSRIILLSALVPNNQVGKNCLGPHLRNYFCDDYDSRVALNPIPLNYEYAIWIWRKFLAGHIRDASCPIIASCDPTPFQSYLNINCIMFDRRLMDLVLPFQTTDENAMNLALAQNDLFGVMLPSSVAHHYSFKYQQTQLDAAIGVAPIADVFGLRTVDFPNFNSDTRMPLDPNTSSRTRIPCSTGI